ncbi:MAG: hypothetical protein BGO31_09325 [Bacteroidetes bacterium 43-16]|nr:MAG: hypothetical protein BGO31_09325 [Bacteroidetes bacterium 43-16]
MKKNCILLLLLAAAHYCTAQSTLPEPNPQAPSNANFYYENKGQIIDNAGNLRNDVLYYTEQGFPKTFLMQEGIAFTRTMVGDTAQANAPDTALRIDMIFACDREKEISCAQLIPYEEAKDHLNYYLPHCPNGVTDVNGYARIVYENAYPDIDVHLYSNSVAMKMYFVVKPGGDPDQIALLFQGQDSIALLANGSLKMFLNNWELSLAQAYAYEIDNANNTNVLGWLPAWNHNGSGTVTVATANYNTAHTLVLAIGSETPQPLGVANMDWSVYYGADFLQSEARICSGQGTTVYHAMSHWDPNRYFAAQNGVTLPVGNTHYDWYISQFDNTARQWGTYYGGSKLDQVAALASNAGGSSSANTGVVWVAGITCSNDLIPGTVLPQYAQFYQDKDAGQGGTPMPHSKFDGLLASFDNLGKLKYKTYFGGTSDDIIKYLHIDQQQQYLYLVGNTKGSNNFSNSPNGQTNGSFPLYSGPNNNFYFKNQKCAVDREDGFIAQFRLRDMSLVWSTLFGGSGKDNIVTVTTKDDIVYIGGQTWNNNGGLNESPSPASAHSTCSFPLSNPNDGSFFQNSNNSYNKNMFIAAFNDKRKLVWSTLLGFSVEGLMDISFNSKGQLLCLGTYNISSQYAPQGAAPNSLGLTPLYNNGHSYFQALPSTPASTNTLMKFSPDRRLLWSTPLAFNNTTSSAQETDFSRSFRAANLVLDGDRIYTTTHIAGINLSVTAANGAYLQAQNASNAGGTTQWDSYIMSLDAHEQLTWSTYFGGGSTPNTMDYEHDFPTGLCVQYPYLYLTGQTNSTNAPYIYCIPGSMIPNSYCDQAYYMGTQPYSANYDAFISRFKIDGLPTGIKEGRKSGDITCTLYPNPVQHSTHLGISSNKNRPVQIQIYDQNGRLLRSIPQLLHAGLNAFNLDCSALPAGRFYITITGENVHITHKMTKL